MFEFTPDYSSYSSTELLNALSLIDRERFAGRLADIRAELARRGVLYEETREEVDGKTRYEVRLLKTVPSETLSKQWESASHVVRIGEGSDDLDFLSASTMFLFIGAFMWWFKGWSGDFKPSILAFTLMLLFVGGALLKLWPKAFQNEDAVVAQHTKRLLLFCVALGLSAVPFVMAQLHKVLADSHQQTVKVLDIFNGRPSCYFRILVERSDSEILQLCQVPSHYLAHVRPNDHIQISLHSSAFGLNIDSRRIVLNPSR